MSIHCLLAILIKFWSKSCITITLYYLKDSAYFTDWYSYKYSTEISKILLISI